MLIDVCEGWSNKRKVCQYWMIDDMIEDTRLDVAPADVRDRIKAFDEFSLKEWVDGMAVAVLQDFARRMSPPRRRLWRLRPLDMIPVAGADDEAESLASTPPLSNPNVRAQGPRLWAKAWSRGPGPGPVGRGPGPGPGSRARGPAPGHGHAARGLGPGT